MGALLRWDAAVRPIPPQVGDRRVVSRFLLWPRKLGGQWRWLGFERIEQEFQRYRVCPPEMRAMDVVGWRAVDWAKPPEEPRYMQVRRVATRLWTEDGHSGGIHGFMVSYPPTRAEYEKRARAELGHEQS